ncbi:MAG TPA: SDR family oxidoreductase [Pseudomonadales bacterium]|nr:SDR family oxidoreductase [Pseudomonadales bacterium]
MKLAIITGASAGIGRATALRFVEYGFDVINVSRRSAKHQSIRDLTCDLASPASINAIAADLIAAVEGAEEVCLVHNACRMAKDTALECDPDDLAVSLAVNIAAPNQINQWLLPILPAGSSLLYVGSTLSEKAVANAFSYVTSKHATVGMMRASCQDLQGKGIHTCCICPGFTDTEMLRTHVGQSQEVMQAIAAMNTFGRMIEPEEIAATLVWAHHNPVMNGAVLHANLGQIES